MARIRLQLQNLSRAFLEVVEQSAIAAARTMGMGDRKVLRSGRSGGDARDHG